ncbi:MAG: hypothetical protein M3N53_14485 [Actinomycetota bacterium]|nr:hypothetical protein [Actinomycetota bacterium]
MDPPLEHQISAAGSIRTAFASLARPPFRGLLVLALFVSLVANTLPQGTDDDVAVIASLVLIALSLYLQIAVTLAAADPNPTPSVDVWLKLAVARRCFWRYVAASVLVVLMVLAAGVVGVIIGAFVVGGIVALADPAVVLERKAPVAAISRSAELGKPARRQLIVIFGALILVPGMSVQVGSFVWDLPTFFGPLWPVVTVIVLVLGMVGAIALTRAFRTLGGEVLPLPPRESRLQRDR